MHFNHTFLFGGEDDVPYQMFQVAKQRFCVLHVRTTKSWSKARPFATCRDSVEERGLHQEEPASRGTLQWMVYFMENPIQMDDWGYPYFRTPPTLFSKIGDWQSNTRIIGPRDKPGLVMASAAHLSPWYVQNVRPVSGHPQHLMTNFSWEHTSLRVIPHHDQYILTKCWYIIYTIYIYICW